MSIAAHCPDLPAELATRLQPFLTQHPAPSSSGTTSVQSPRLHISRQGLQLITAEQHCSLRDAMLFCLEHRMWPSRFVRNCGLLTPQEQSLLLQSHVAVIGCGGLGGHVLLALARLGIGTITCCDMDTFDETNLNRQALCYEDNIGKPKALIAKEELTRVASHATVNAHVLEANEETLPEILRHAHLALDSVVTRLHSN